MELSAISFKNYRLLSNATLDVHKETTLIVGRNNTAKTSSFNCVYTVLSEKAFSYDDYPLGKRKELYDLFTRYMSKAISYDELCCAVPKITIEFLIDYSADDPDDNLGALSPFIIDVDIDTTTARISVEYRIKMNETNLWNLLEKGFYTDGDFMPDTEKAQGIIRDNFSPIFGISVFAINPKDDSDRQEKSLKELKALFPLYYIPAERVLGEDGSQNNNSLTALISNYFSVAEEDLDPAISKEILTLRQTIDNANREVQKKSDEILSAVVRKAVGFGYPNSEELQLGVITQLSIDDQIKNQTKLSYTASGLDESLPSTHNGLGYKNLIKIEFLLAAFAKDVEKQGGACLPLLFIEEPESHMHPQMQHAFAEYLESFLRSISDTHIQAIITSHSAHIANTMDFSKIRYAQKTVSGVCFKNLASFADENTENTEFIKKYLTLSRCDLFFADKVIFVEGASERLLLPDMIEKCNALGLFDSCTYRLPAQYYALIEIGGAYAYKFIPFTEFLGIPCLILTDIDSMEDGRTKALVSKGKTTSNSTIKWWVRKVKSLPEGDTSLIALSDIIALTSAQKTSGKCHIEFQTAENGLCGRSLEEAIKNVNRTFYDLQEPVSEESLTFMGKSKTDFALGLICNHPSYEIPQYIKNGLVWLNEERVLE